MKWKSLARTGLATTGQTTNSSFKHLIGLRSFDTIIVGERLKAANGFRKSQKVFPVRKGRYKPYGIEESHRELASNRANQIAPIGKSQ